MNLRALARTQLPEAHEVQFVSAEHARGSHPVPGFVPAPVPGGRNAALEALVPAWRAVTEHVSDAAALTDPEGRLLALNPAARERLGFDEAEVAGLCTALLWLDPLEVSERLGGEATDCGRLMRLLERCSRRGADGEWTLIRKDGTRFPASVAVRRVPHGGAGPGPYTLTLTDLSAGRQHAEELHRIAVNARCILWSADVRETGMETLLAWEQQFPEQEAQQFIPLELDPGESYKTGWYLRRFEEDRDHCDALAAESIRAGRNYAQEFRIRCADGSVRWIREDLQVETRVEGKHWRVHAVATDITDRHLAQQALEEASRRKDEFLAMLAHELRSPLAPIRNAAQILAVPEASVEARERAVRTLGRQIEHMSRLIDDLMDVSRIAEGKITLRFERVDLQSIVEQAVAGARTFLEERRHRLTLALPPDPILLRADATRLVQVLVNLLHNAARYTDPEGAVELSAAAEADLVVLRVRDNGRGIAPELLPTIFDLYVQGSPAASRRDGGLGIGLTLVKRLVELHGGTVSAHSDGPGSGSEFTLRLPRQRDSG